MFGYYNFKPEDLRDVEQKKVAIALGAILIEQTEAAIKRPLMQLRDIVWRSDESNKNNNNHETFEQDVNKRTQRAEQIKKVFESVASPEDKKKLAEAYTRLGHLYEIAGHVARENFFLNREDKCQTAVERVKDKASAERKLDLDDVTPGGMHQLLFVEKKGEKNPFVTMGVSDVVKNLSKPITEYIFTQHPTNTNTLPSMKLQRDIASEAEKVVGIMRSNNGKADISALKAVIGQFANEDLVQENSFTAKDETEICVNFLTNAYHDLDRLYEVSERALERKFGAEYNDTQRTNLDLKVRFGSWGSAGDKDGNNNIKSENTLEAIIMHKQKAAELLAESLAGVKGLTAPGLTGWKLDWEEKFKGAAQAYKALFKKIEDIRKSGNDIPLKSADFEKLSEQAQNISKELGDVESFKKELKNAASITQGEQKNQLLGVLRKTRVFGFNLGKIEYRETADEYKRVVNLLMNTKKAQDAFGEDARTIVMSNDEESRAEALKNILQSDEKRKIWAEISQQFMKDHDGASKIVRNYGKNPDNRDYNVKADGDEAIVYQTLRRMELARDFDDMITHNVLAEAQGVDSMMEALALQYAVTNYAGKRAKMHIVPLFEDAETMAKIPSVIEDSLANEVYHGHVKELLEREQKTNPEAKLTQQIQIAHSDNARRAGAIASRGIIHQGHVEAREAMNAFNEGKPDDQQINLEFFEGGSLSDSYRNGVRAHTAMIEDFGLGEFGKFTFQGGDLLNYFNQPTSMERVLLRGIVKQAEMMAGMHENGVDQTLEANVRAGIKNLQKQYDADIYEAPGNPIGRLLYELGYRDHIAAGNAGTRGGARKIDPDEEANRAIDATAVRTIGFSETLQHEGLHPTFMGAGEVRKTIQTAIGGAPLDAAGWKKLYDESPSFKDVTDKLSYSIVNSDLRRPMEKIIQKQYNDPKLDELIRGTFDVQIEKLSKEIKTLDSTKQNALLQAIQRVDKSKGRPPIDAIENLEKHIIQHYGNNVSSVDRFLNNVKLDCHDNHLDIPLKDYTNLQSGWHKKHQDLLEFVRDELPKQYIEAAKLVYEAKTGKSFSNFNIELHHETEKLETGGAKSEHSTPFIDAAERIKYAINNLEEMEHLKPLNYKRRFVEGVEVVKESVKESLGDITGYFARLFHNAVDTFTHGRTFMADDPTFRAAYVDQPKAQSRA